MNSPISFFRFAAVWPFLGLILASLHAQTPVLRWAFDDGRGVPTVGTGISGGVLSIQGVGPGRAVFKASGGVGAATSGVFDGSANVYGDQVGAARIDSAASPLRVRDELAQFVFTMWIKPSVAPAKQPYARLFNVSKPESEQSRPGLYVALHGGDIEVGVNGNIAIVPLPPDTIKEGGWTFVAFAYDGAAKNPYYSVEMQDAVQSERNGAILTGSAREPVKLAGPVGLNTGLPDYNVSAGPLALDGLSVALGSSNSTAARAFCGLIDDVRIYKGLLTTEQIDAIRLSAKAK